MGMIHITIPQDIELHYHILSPKLTDKLIQTFDSLEQESVSESDLVVGMWKDRFSPEMPSNEIQKQWRNEQWKRF